MYIVRYIKLAITATIEAKLNLLYMRDFPAYEVNICENQG